MTASLKEFVYINAQTPTTSDIPATIGNEFRVKPSLSYNTLQTENVTVVTPQVPPEVISMSANLVS